MITLTSLLNLAQCPECRTAGTLSAVDSEDCHSKSIRCASCEAIFPLFKARPVLLREDNSLFRVRDYVDSRQLKRDVTKRRFIQDVFPLSVNLARRRVLNGLREWLSRYPVSTVLVVGGGGQREEFGSCIGQFTTSSVVYIDIDVSADVDAYCDAHELPFQSEVFDVVITTAVLEHVMDPPRVAAEIHRVLRTGGMLYSEMPFMQQVHEGAYDVTRYSLVGHRRLFRRFRELDSGMVAGPGTALAWAVEHFLLAVASGVISTRVQ